MAIFGISDLHLSFSSNKPMDIFKGWENHTDRIRANWIRMVKDEDTVVLPGDLSWALKLEDTLEDFRFLDFLPGKKVILKGNHDLWWSTVKKIKDFFEKEKISTVDIVFNNCYPIGEYAVCGTRGWIEEKASDKKILLREAGRLEASIKDALLRNKKPIVFLHYPIVYADSVAQDIIDVLKKYGITQVYHGHIHGSGFAKIIKEYEGISFKLIACDSLDFAPFEILLEK